MSSKVLITGIASLLGSNFLRYLLTQGYEVIGIWIRKSINREPLCIYGDGLQTRTFSDVQYYFKPFEKVMFEGDGEIFNLSRIKSVLYYLRHSWCKNVPKILALILILYI